MKHLLIASTSTIYGSAYLTYLLPEVTKLYIGVKEVLFIPYARPNGISYNDYTNIVRAAFDTINISIKGIHEFENATKAIENAKGIFVGGGNTFVLVDMLHKKNLMTQLKNTIEIGTPYLGTSAGSNICGPTMQTTNDMPIVQPSTYETMNIIPFNINAHYLDPNTNSKHKGETREVRIQEFHVFNDTSVLGLREGSWLEVKNNQIVLKGKLTARLFKKDKEAIEIEPYTNLNLLN